MKMVSAGDAYIDGLDILLDLMILYTSGDRKISSQGAPLWSNFLYSKTIRV